MSIHSLEDSVMWMGRVVTIACAALGLTTGLLAQSAAGQQEYGSGPLKRRAQWDAALVPADSGGGAVVRRVTAGSPAARAGLTISDRVVSLNGWAIPNADAFSRAHRAVRGGDSVRARVTRSGSRDTLTVRFVVDSVPHERIAGTTVTYDAVRSDRGYLVRTIVSRPERLAAARIPAVLFVPWLSCDAVEKPDPGNDGFAHMLRAVASGSGAILMRVEKPGVGDSGGPDCRDAGLDDELAAYRAGLRALRARADVDTTRVYLFGGSIGGALAPVLAAEAPGGIAGVIAVAGFSRTWYEHMLDIERRRLTLSGQSPAAVNAAMRGFAQFYTGYLLEGRTPAEVLAANPAIRPLWYDEPAHQYGRPAAYYHAVQRLDVEAAWATLATRRVPSLVVWGEYDWIMGRAEAERPIEIVDAIAPGLVRLVVLDKTNHGLMAYESAAAAFGGGRPRHDGAAGRAVTAWLREQFAGRR